MAETYLPLTNEKQMNGVEMGPSISTPLQQKEAKRKRPSENNETELARRRKKPRKKMYRPKVIGEGRQRKSEGGGPDTPNHVVPKPRTEKLRPLPKPRTRKRVLPKTPCQNNTKSLEDDNQLNAIVSCAEIEAKEAEDDRVIAMISCRDLTLVENGLESEKASEEVVAIEAKESKEDDMFSCSDLVLVQNGLESEKAIEEVEGGEEDNSKSIVIRTTVGLIKRLDESFYLPQECKRKRGSRRTPRKIIERKPYGLSFRREKKGRGSRNKLLPFFFMKRKRTTMVRRCNLASVLAVPICNQLPRNIHKHGVKSKETENLNGNEGWPIKKPKNHQKSQASLNTNSRDDEGGTKIEALVCQSPINLEANGTANVNKEETLKEGLVQTSISQANGIDTSIVNEEQTLTKESTQTSLSQANERDTSTGTTVTNVNKEEILTKGLAQTSLSQTSSKFSDEGGLQKMENLFHNKKLSKYNEQLTITWLDIKHFLTNSRLFNGRSEKNPPEKGLSIPRITTGFHNVGGGRNLTEQQNFTLSARPSGNANELKPTLRLILWNNSEGITNNHEDTRFTSETRANNKGVLGEETDSFCNRQLVPYAADGHHDEALFGNVSTYLGTNNTGLLHHHLQKEGTNSVHKKQIIPYVRKGGKKHNKHKQNPNSVHEMQGAMVPHPKSLNSTKKKELGRVYLDPRDITVWKALFESDNNSDKEKIDKKWWADEREVFRGRINAFNARMHVILGDRRFSPWKGSVVDSVVGVFLTQNVSDHLSSSAYMSLAATFPLLETENHTENYHGEEIICIQQSTQRNEHFFLCESKWNNNSMMEDNKATGDPKEAKELMSADDAISSHDCLGSSAKESLDLTLLLSTCLEDDCGTCLSKNLDGIDNQVLHSNKSTFEQEPYSSSPNSTSSCGSNQENKTLESKEVDWRDQNPISEDLSPGDTMLRSFRKSYLCSECISKSKSGLENNVEDSSHCGEMAVDLQFTPNEKSQRFINNFEKFQNQEIQPAKCCLCSECNAQTKNGIKKTTEIYDYYQGKMEVGSQLLGDIDDSSQKSDFDVEKVKSQESVIQASDSTNEAREREKNEAKRYLEDRSPNHLNDEKETDISKGKAKKSKMKQEVDWNGLREKWDSMRRKHRVHEPRSHGHMDSVDWEAVRSAEPTKIADAIKERGQHNIIAGRIKEFLDRTARIHGSIDLEWLRHAPPEDVKEYLLEIDGLGLKSVECIRLLALQQIAFPVDINVGRIAVRLGWVPLEPLPEEVQMHLLETFPMMDSIQKYLWPRLCTLDQRTLYELHYQLITFGKVFCTKRKPNCNACPLRADCRHYASAYASARLALPGLPEKGIVRTMAPDKSFEGTAQVMNPTSVLHIDANPFSGPRCQTNNCEPIIEVPPSPEPAYDESQLTDIEDLCEYDSDDVPIIRLSSGQFTTTSLNCMDDNITRALVPLHSKAASIPMRKLKHIDRLRTEHQAYELPDNHPLLSKLERREPNDPCPYLLCILSPGETVDSSEPPSTRCTYQEMGELCTEGSCSSCNIVREQKNGTVRGTILIPCRTAMRGKFPLNGTYFQVNEVFADDETSKKPIHVPREWIWDLPRRITYFGTSTTTIFRGLAKEDIQYCFQKGFVCVRGFNQRTRTPRRLAERLHRATTASIKARANKNEDHKQKTFASNSKSPQEL